MARPLPRGASWPGRCRHNRGQEARGKPELAVEPDMLGALCEGEEPGMASAPSIERVTRGGDEALTDTAVVTVGTHRYRAKKANATPARREVRTQELAILFGREGRDVLGAEARMGIRRE